MGIWEYLIWRAILAGIKVDDNGVNVEFKTEEDGIELIGLFWKEPRQNANTAAEWLAGRGVNIPGFDGHQPYVEMMEVARAE